MKMLLSVNYKIDKKTILNEIKKTNLFKVKKKLLIIYLCINKTRNINDIIKYTDSSRYFIYNTISKFNKYGLKSIQESESNN